MTKYRTTQYVHEDGTKYVFVTRGKSEPVTNEEIIEYIKREQPQKTTTLRASATPTARELIELARLRGHALVVDEPKVPPFIVPKEREKIFLADLKRGIPFCEQKYGTKEPALIAEAFRIYPSLNLQKLWEKPNGPNSKTS